MIKNKKKQDKIIKRLTILRNLYLKLSPITYQEEYNKFIERKESLITFSSEDAETFYDRKDRELDKILLAYNNLNEKLPHHIRLDLLE